MSTIPLGPFRLSEDKEARIEELSKLVEDLWLAVRDLQDALIVQSKAAPGKLREGDIRFADGTNWNPGSGKGLYQYLGGVWTRL